MPDLLARIALKPRQRAFVVASTGSGKSTLSLVLLDRYHRDHGNHHVFIIDPKQRYVPAYREEGNRTLFPDGYTPLVHGRREAVAVVGDVLRSASFPADGVGIVHSDSLVWELFDFLYSNSDVSRPSIVFADESFDFQKGVRAHPSFRRLMQQGREIGVGMLVINQAPHWIDGTLLRESETFYIGTLHDPRDRKRMEEECMGTPLHSELRKALPLYRWMFINRRDWNQSLVFDLELD